MGESPGSAGKTKYVTTPPSIRRFVTKRPWLEIAENAALVGSALGTVAAAISQQVVYAAAPLTVALWLNATNRHRLEQQMRQYNKSAIADVHQVVQSLHHQIHTLPPAETVDLDPITQSLAQLAQQFDNRPELEQIQELKDALSSLPHPLELEKAIACQIEIISTSLGT